MAIITSPRPLHGCLRLRLEPGFAPPSQFPGEGDEVFSSDRLARPAKLAGGGDPPAPQSLERLQAEYDQQIAKGGRDGPSFGIEVDDVFIGQCALFNFDAVARTSEIGITIGDEKYLGRGFGREAIGLLVEYGFVHRNIHKVWLHVHARTERAKRAYSACGFIEEGRLRDHVWSNGGYDDLSVMGLMANDWKNHVTGRSPDTPPSPRIHE